VGTTESLTDATFPHLLVLAQQGDAEAFRCLFNDLQPRLLRYLAGVEPRGADDIAGDAWVNIARQLRDFQGGLGEFRAWAFVIVRRRVSDYRHREGRQPQVPHEGDFFEVSADTADKLDAIEQLSAREAASLMLALLPAEQSEVVLLRVVVGLDVAHVAEIVGRTENWVRITQHRALRSLEDRFRARRRLAPPEGGRSPE
jgi:RNA polymerase sigma-70 factor (ECF subfamily)